jgi:hypothetical protein
MTRNPERVKYLLCVTSVTNVLTQVGRLAEGVETPAIIGWNCYPRPKGRGYSPDL